MSDARQFAQQLVSARRGYEQTRDFNAYLSDCVYVALRIAAAELAAQDHRLAHLGTGLSAAQYGIKGLVDLVANRLACPIDSGRSHEDFLSEFARHAKRFIDRDMHVVKNVLNQLGL